MGRTQRLAALMSAAAVAAGLSLGTATAAQARGQAAGTGAAQGTAAAPATASCLPSDGTQPPVPAGNQGDFLEGVAVASACDVWAAGFRAIEGTRYPLIEHWTGGGSWTVVPAPNRGDGNGDAELDDVSAASATDIWAVGSYTDASRSTRPLMLHWDGTSWTQIDIPGSFALRSVTALSASDAWAVGGPTILHWDGSDWAPTQLLPGKVARSVAATSPSDVWVAGRNVPDTPLMLHWDGSSWTRFPLPDGGYFLLGLTAVSATDAWAVGLDVHPDGSAAPVTLHWDGTSWAAVPTPSPATGGVPAAVLIGVAASSASSVWAVGSYTTGEDGPGGQGKAGLVLHWDGTRWSQVAAPHPGMLGELDGVAAGPAGSIWTAGVTADTSFLLGRAAAWVFGTVPSVIGQDEGTATGSVQAAGLGVTVTSVQTADGGCGFSTAGTVLATTPAAGTIATPPVNLRVCNIPNVPDLTGDTRTEASAALQGNGLVLGTVRTILDPACTSINKVISQDPSPGASIRAGSAVFIWVGRQNPSHPCPPGG